MPNLFLPNDVRLAQAIHQNLWALSLRPSEQTQPDAEGGAGARPLSDAWLGSRTARHRDVAAHTFALEHTDAAKAQSVAWPTAAGVLHGTCLAPRGAEATHKPCVLFLGDAGEPAARGACTVAGAYVASGCAVWVMDYRGFGLSPGVAQRDTLLQDAIAMFDAATQSLNLPAHPIVVHGLGLGAAIAAQLVHHIEATTSQSPCALVLDRPGLASPQSGQESLGWLAGLLGASWEQAATWLEPLAAVSHRVHKTALVPAADGMAQRLRGHFETRKIDCHLVRVPASTQADHRAIITELSGRWDTAASSY